jgi:hypothetical protein
MTRKMPNWAVGVRGVQADPRELVDACVNANAGARPTVGELAAHNLMVLVRRARGEGRDALMERLLGLAQYPGTVISPKRRAGFALRWYRRLASEAMKEVDFG